jgi:adenylate cyclase
MHLNIGQKIFGIAAVVLVLMVAVAAYSIHLTAGISEDVRVLANRDMPITQAVARINVQTLTQSVDFQRLLAMNIDNVDEVQVAKAYRERFLALGQTVDRDFERARATLKAHGEVGLAGHLDAIEREYKAFQTHGWNLIKAFEGGRRDTFEGLAQKLDAQQDVVNQQITALHDYMARLSDKAVRHVDGEERRLLMVNSVLTALAAVLAAIFAAIVTRILVRAVRNLVYGAEAVQAGNLDTEVQPTTCDEVGRLTAVFNDMVGGLRLKERIKDTFGKYMDPRIVSGLLDHPEFSNPGGERREMSVMFIDLKGFTSISEKLEAGDLVDMINTFFAHMGEAISDNQGVVDKYMGDAVMAYWGPPFCAPDDHARLACWAALEALARLDDFRAEVHERLGAAAEGLDIDLRIGLSSGEMIVGTIGSKVSRNFTVMGDPVNLGSRLEGANKAYGTHILVSERTRELAGGDMAFREIDQIRVKGKHKPVRVYELMNGEDAKRDLSTGLAAYRAQDWDSAEAQFAAVDDDTTAKVYLERIAQLRASAPPADWDGVWVFENK